MFTSERARDIVNKFTRLAEILAERAAKDLKSSMSDSYDSCAGMYGWGEQTDIEKELVSLLSGDVDV